MSGRSVPTSRNCDAIAVSLDIDRNEVRRRAGRREVRDLEPKRGRRSLCYPGLRTVVFVPIIGEVPADAAELARPGDRSCPLDPSEIVGINEQVIVIATEHSMAGRGIKEGDYLLVDADATPTAGEIVVIRIGDEFVMREWWPEGENDVVLRTIAPERSRVRIGVNDEYMTLVGVVMALSRGWKRV
jgi:SOS-response transcriptional repressor LexA